MSHGMWRHSVTMKVRWKTDCKLGKRKAAAKDNYLMTEIRPLEIKGLILLRS